MATADPQIIALQNEVNRFAADPNIGFDPIGCDGLAGPQTLAGVLYALTTINLSPQIDPTTQALAGSFIDSLNAASDLTANSVVLTNSLQAAAGTLGYGYIACPPVSSGLPAPRTSAAATAIAKYLATKSGLTTNFLGLPTWALYTGGGALVLGLLYYFFGRKPMRRRRAA